MTVVYVTNLVTIIINSCGIDWNKIHFSRLQHALYIYLYNRAKQIDLPSRVSTVGLLLENHTSCFTNNRPSDAFNASLKNMRLLILFAN